MLCLFLGFNDSENPIIISSTGSSHDKSLLASVLHPYEDEVYVWCQDPKQHTCQTPQFWLILEITPQEVHIFFQYREGQFEALLPWRQTLQLIAGTVRELCKIVNQKLLLNDLHETKTCNRLLEPEQNEEVLWSMSRNNHDAAADDSDEADEGEENVTYLEANLNVRFKPGLFACPLVWEKSIPLHSRLRESIGNHSRGLQVTRMVLNAFAVANRKNMFAYCDDRKNIYYFKIKEVITKCSTSGSNKMDFWDADLMLRSRSSSISSHYHEPNEDRIELKVYGIEEAGPNIQQDLMAVLTHKLNEKVVEIISTFLQRNPMCKLAPEDVLFLQGPNSIPSQCLRFKVNPAMTPHLDALQYYLRQNVVHQIAIVPKYTSQRTVFRDNVDSIEVPSADIFLYNKCNASGGRRGLACISMTIVDGHGAAILSNTAVPKGGTKTQKKHQQDLETLKSYIQVRQVIQVLNPGLLLYLIATFLRHSQSLI